MATMHSLFTQVLVQKNLSKVGPEIDFVKYNAENFFPRKCNFQVQCNKRNTVHLF